MNEELVKNLTSLIDETLVELEDLKKSRYSASEVDMGKMEDGMSGHPANGSIDKKEDDDDEDKDKDKDKEDAEKAEGKNSEADPGTRGVTDPAMCANPGKSSLHAEAAKSEDDKDDDDDDDDDKDEAKKAEGKNSEADPGARGVVKPSEAANPGKSNLMEEAKKSIDENSTLMKSYIDKKIGGLEGKLDGIATLVKELADTPVDRKGTPASAVPLQKSADHVESLSKSEVLDKLFEMKKSDPRSVDTADVIAVETNMGLQSIVDKYKLK